MAIDPTGRVFWDLCLASDQKVEGLQGVDYWVQFVRIETFSFSSTLKPTEDGVCSHMF